MTVADRIRQQAAELQKIADELDRAAPMPAANKLPENGKKVATRVLMPAPGRDPFYLDTNRAMKISRRSSSWLYANAQKFGFGWKIRSGSWAFSEQHLRAFMAGQMSTCEESELCEKSERSPLSVSPERGIVEFKRKQP
jgi:hypothetical protein